MRTIITAILFTLAGSIFAQQPGDPFWVKRGVDDESKKLSMSFGSFSAGAGGTGLGRAGQGAIGSYRMSRTRSLDFALETSSNQFTVLTGNALYAIAFSTVGASSTVRDRNNRFFGGIGLHTIAFLNQPDAVPVVQMGDTMLSLFMGYNISSESFIQARFQQINSTQAVSGTSILFGFRF